MAWLDLFRWGRKAANAYDLLRAYAAQYRSRSGKPVNIETAIGVSTVFGCCRVVGHGMAQVPFKLMRYDVAKKTRLPATAHPLFDLLSTKPNAWMTSFEFRETISWHLELCLNAYVYVNRSVLGRVLELQPLEPNCVTVHCAPDYTLSYKLRGQSGATIDVPASDIWHIRGPSWNGWQGMDFLKSAREAIGLAMASEESQASLHANGVQTTGMISIDGKLQDDQHKQIAKWIERENVGSGRAGKPLVMDRSAKWTPLAMSGIDAQHLETRRHQVEEICRFIGVMPIMVGYSDKAPTYASAEQMFLAHAVHTLSPRWARIEQSADANLLTDEERAEGYYFDFVEEGMIRGAAKDTKDVLLGYVNGGLMTPNEGRAKLDLNPDSDSASDELRIPVNVAQDPKAMPADTGAPTKGE